MSEKPRQEEFLTAAGTAGVCLVLAGIALAGPSFRIGTKLTGHLGESYSQWEDSAQTLVVREVYEQTSVGPTVEASYGPAWGFLSGRLDLAQVSVFTSGGAAFRLFPMLGLDLMAEPPTQWRVKSYVWAGVRTTGYARMPATPYPVLQHDSETHWRAGLGGKFRLTRRIDLFAETQWYARDSYWEGVQMYPDGSFLAGSSMTEVIGLVSAEIGARFALGK